VSEALHRGSIIRIAGWPEGQYATVRRMAKDRTWADLRIVTPDQDVMGKRIYMPDAVLMRCALITTTTVQT
jgi:hypothetical protein